MVLDEPLSILGEYLTAQKSVSSLSLLNKKLKLVSLRLLRHKMLLSDTLGILSRIPNLDKIIKRDNSQVNKGSTLKLNTKIKNNLNINSGIDLNLGRN